MHFYCSAIISIYLLLLLGTGGNLDITDLIDSNNNDFLPLTMRRIYNHNILKKRTAGPMGMGWILPHWFVITIVSQANICGHFSLTPVHLHGVLGGYHV